MATIKLICKINFNYLIMSKLKHKQLPFMIIKVLINHDIKNSVRNFFCHNI